MAPRSTAHELAEISAFCRERTRDYYRFDPLKEESYGCSWGDHCDACTDFAPS